MSAVVIFTRHLIAKTMLAWLMTTHQIRLSFDGRFDLLMQRISLAFPTLAMLAFVFTISLSAFQTGMKWPLKSNVSEGL
jgi:hypothetical protein